MENLYLLLITNRASNIIEDLETLRLLSKGIAFKQFYINEKNCSANLCNFFVVVPDVAGTANNLNEEKISDKCFDLIFAFDEVVLMLLYNYGHDRGNHIHGMFISGYNCWWIPRAYHLASDSDKHGHGKSRGEAA